MTIGHETKAALDNATIDYDLTSFEAGRWLRAAVQKTENALAEGYAMDECDEMIADEIATEIENEAA